MRPAAILFFFSRHFTPHIWNVWIIADNTAFKWRVNLRNKCKFWDFFEICHVIWSKWKVKQFIHVKLRIKFLSEYKQKNTRLMSLIPSLNWLLCLAENLYRTFLNFLSRSGHFLSMPEMKDIEKVKESANDQKQSILLALLALAISNSVWLLSLLIYKVRSYVILKRSTRAFSRSLSSVGVIN